MALTHFLVGPKAKVWANLAFAFDVSPAARNARQLRLSNAALRNGEDLMARVAEEASLGVWVRDVSDDSLWKTEHGHARFSFRVPADIPVSAEAA